MGPGVAQECVETKDGLHIWEDHFYPEVIDPLTGEVLPDGEEGELVFTSLTKQAMPVIRYRTRDLTRLLPGTARTMRRMEKITGRTDDMIILRGVNLFPTQIEELIMRVPVLSPHFQLHLTRAGPDGRDGRPCRAPHRGGARPTAAPAGEQLSHLIKNTIGVSITTVVRSPVRSSVPSARCAASWTTGRADASAALQRDRYEPPLVIPYTGASRRQVAERWERCWCRYKSACR